MSVIRHPKGNIKIKLSLAGKDSDTEIKKQTDLAISQAQHPGFRKGKAPRGLVKPKLDKPQLLSQSLSQLLPKIYTQIIDTNKLKPILYPQIQINKGKWGEDFEFTATTCEAPTVTLPQNYPDKIKQIESKDPESVLAKILEYLHKNSQTMIPDPLVQEESNHRLSRLAENLSQLGMDMGKYRTTKKLTAQDLKAHTCTDAHTD